VKELGICDMCLDLVKATDRAGRVGPKGSWVPFIPFTPRIPWTLCALFDFISIFISCFTPVLTLPPPPTSKPGGVSGVNRGTPEFGDVGDKLRASGDTGEV
jgi:hypothetical protein